MISIIVSTYKPENWSAFVKNVEETIGVEYEIVKIDNPGIMSLCEVYNRGIKLAKYPYLCFSHDDIVFSLQNWGANVIDFFQKQPEYGLIGIAGVAYKTWTPTGWYFPDDRHFCKMDMYQATHNFNDREHLLRNKPSDRNFDDVITLDGCWFCTTSKVVSEFKFDENTFTSYHCYDIDFALQVGQKYKVGVVYDLDITHVSHGQYNKVWVKETFKLFEKWKKQMPRSILKVSGEEQSYNEFNAFLFILGKISENKIGLFHLFLVLYNPKMIKIVGLKRWLLLNKWTLGSLIRFLSNK